MNQQSILVSHAGGPEVLELGETPIPAPGAGQVLVKVEAAGVNFIETYQRSGVYAVDYPFTPGSEFSGTVTQVGENVRHLKVGDRVATSSGTKGYAQYAVVGETELGKVPDKVDLRLAAALPLQGMTSHYLTHSSYLVHSGDVILSYAGAGGVGLLLTQILKMKGATVITTASTQEKKDLARAAGADYVVDYDQVEATVDKVTGGVGVHAVYDGIGKDTFETSLKVLKRRGTLVLFGGASGQVPPFDLQRLNAAGSLTVTRPKLSDFLATDEERAWRFGDVLGWAASGDLDVRVGQKFALADASKAHSALESRKTTGKVLLVP
ncbi:NADPH:quinone reductase [Arthrobacter sp. MYb229]|uniref:quinone oxidoreductase family protein n=1 Tax=unclassified Arthrobacter TaxID=235627 RepID=UPI000CFDB8EF|nr:MULTISPECIES: quinone oxidoreductase [unclassified Arthrobacter]PRA01858.1 NADPH:quinone reductase [Arthrobacter sp. MYb229]PRB50367.1 NADPH:quinone reductase [Arthrobacter sp. MYb216]